MAGQHPSRRHVLQALGFAALAGAAPGFSRWHYAFATEAMQHAGHTSPEALPQRAEIYQPVFCNAQEYGLVQTLATLILPGKLEVTPQLAQLGTSMARTPKNAGAAEAGVAEFIDYMVSKDVAMQPSFRDGLAWMNDAAKPDGFVSLSKPSQQALLDRIAYRKNFRAEEAPGQHFFAQIRKLTVMGFYTSRIGLESLDYPGLHFYAHSPTVPNDAFLQSLNL